MCLQIKKIKSAINQVNCDGDRMVIEDTLLYGMNLSVDWKYGIVFTRTKDAIPTQYPQAIHRRLSRFSGINLGDV